MTRCALVLLIFAISYCESGHADVINGSFETNTGSEPTGWISPGNLNVISNQGESDGNNSLAFNWNNTAPTAVLSQSFTTINGQVYSLSFDFGQYSVFAGTSASLDVDVFDGTGFAGTQLLDQMVLDTTGIAVDSSAVFDSFEFLFTATGTTTTLRFTDTTPIAPPGSPNTFGYDAMLDNVSVQAVPEPTSASVVLIGLTLFGASRRRR